MSEPMFGGSAPSGVSCVLGKAWFLNHNVEERPVAVPDLMATICKALGIDPSKQNLSDVGRPIRIADPSARPITEALA